MLSFGLKLVWFSLSLSGLIGCWAVLLPLAWAIQSYWAPIAYAIGITALEGIFCLGLVWKMNPPNIPRAFCLAQVLIGGLATFFIVGVLAAMTTATTIYVAKPKQWGTQNDPFILPWRFYYLLPVMLFPLLASIVQITFVISFDNFEPVDGLNCVARPLWIRLLGYAGTPYLVTIPCLWLTAVSTIRVIRTHGHIRRARRSVDIENLDHLTVIPQRKSRPSLKIGTTSPTPHAITSPSPAPSVIARMTSESRRQPINDVLQHERITSFHLPFLPPSPDYMTAHSSRRSPASQYSFETVSSVSFAEMTSKSAPLAGGCKEKDDVTTPLRPVDSSPHGTTRSTRHSSRSIHNSDRISITQLAFSMQHVGSTETSQYFSYSSQTSSISRKTPTTTHTEHRNPSKLSSTVRSLIIFQFAIICIHLLSSITPLVDIISSTPAAFGTQHVALVLAAWAPVIIFSPLSAVRSQLAFWR
ncbi:hypothetical protein C8F04DRAFT_239911 [Mycena alexandri]|uniref:Uncharacterized protein n=1 Tax=Mycena alexandri TaxID=1745969 RepID=A0AAD6T8V5_9AGAR|nr:hypothetical protein C8F04DRAFT_239911 [Mycena alexandri]